MILTSSGRVFLRNIDGALHSIRRARAEASAGNITDASYLRIGSIEDFDSDIFPELAVYLSGTMPKCDFLYETETSHVLIQLLRDRELDLGVATTPPERYRDLIDRPILRDPFVVALPSSKSVSLSNVVSGETPLPFLRFSSKLIIARQVEAQLRRTGISFANSFECSNNQTLMAMVAAGAGWTITTPLLFARAKRFHSKVEMHRFPGKSFSRELAIVSTPDCSRSVVDIVDRKLRDLTEKYAIRPILKSNPWLDGQFTLVE